MQRLYHRCYRFLPDKPAVSLSTRQTDRIAPKNADLKQKSMRVGNTIPDLTVTVETGERQSLAAIQDSQAMVLYFYPKDETPVCTKEACSFRDAYEDFVEAGAVVVGVSGDTVASHRAFARHHRLPFTLVADVGGALRKAFRVPRMMGFMDGRTTYVIDKKGVVRHVFTAHFAANEHVTEALAVVRDLMTDD